MDGKHPPLPPKTRTDYSLSALSYCSTFVHIAEYWHHSSPWTTCCSVKHRIGSKKVNIAQFDIRLPNSVSISTLPPSHTHSQLSLFSGLSLSCKHRSKLNFHMDVCCAQMVVNRFNVIIKYLKCIYKSLSAQIYFRLDCTILHLPVSNVPSF